jgi:hypothetical protein
MEFSGAVSSSWIWNLLILIFIVTAGEEWAGSGPYGIDTCLRLISLWPGRKPSLPLLAESQHSSPPLVRAATARRREM